MLTKIKALSPFFLLTTTLLVFSLISLATSRQIIKLIQMREMKLNQGWVYLGKMSFRQGTVDVKIQTEKAVGQPKTRSLQLMVNFIPQDQWKDEEQLKCKTTPNVQTQHILTHQVLLQAPSISEHTLRISEQQHQQMYYIVIRDCEKKLQPDYNSIDVAFKISLQIINNGGYLGQQEDHWLIIPLIIGIGLWMIMSDKYFLKAQFQSDPDYAKMILFGGIATNISSLMWRSFGYLIYRNFGSNYLLFHIIYLFMHSISETMVIGLLILISMGWSLNYLTGPRVDIAIPIVSFLAIMNIILTLMTQLSNTSHDMHHTFDATTGYILIIMRMVLAFAFILSTIYTIRQSRYRIRQFLKLFGLLGMLYILAMPMIVYVANRLIRTGLRNQFVFVMVEIVKSVCNVCLMYMVSSSRSEYNKLCYKNASFLPSQTGLF